MKGRTKKPLPVTIEGIGRKSELKLLGVTFNEDPCSWVRKQALDCTF